MGNEYKHLFKRLIASLASKGTIKELNIKSIMRKVDEIFIPQGGKGPPSLISSWPQYV